MPAFKDEHIIIIAPGSQTTLAQLGLPESFTPARLRVKTRMFPAEAKGEYEPFRIRRKAKKPKQDDATVNGTAPAPQPNPEDANGDAPATQPPQIKPETDQDDEPDLEEDPNSDAGAIWPMQAGRIVDWPAFFALLQHIHKTLEPPFHTPILLISQPAWTPRDHERLTQFFFETFKCPAFTIMDAASATCYAYGLSSACVIDVGKEKADVTAVTDFEVQERGRAIAIPDCGGEAMTTALLDELRKDGFDRDMCEQLKMSPICEILPSGTPIPGSATSTTTQQANGQQQQPPSNPAAAASTGAEGSGPGQRHTQGALGEAPRGPGPGTEERPEDAKMDEDNEGVIDVANIVTSGRMNEYLERKEREKAERLAAKNKKADAAAAAQAKALKLRNSEKPTNTFVYEDRAARERAKDAEEASVGPVANGDVATAGASTSDDKPPADPSQAPASLNGAPAPDAAAPTSPASAKPSTGRAYTRTLTVGAARFHPLPDALLTTLTSSIHRVIQSVPSPNDRQKLWEHLLIIGSGARVRGFKDALLAALNTRFLVSPSSATIFTSELPSNFTTTPGGTGANTPAPVAHGAPPPSQLPPNHGAGVNPLLYAATTAQNRAHLAPPHPQNPPHQHQLPAYLAPSHHTSHSQTPTSIRAARLPEYFAEWREPGADAEAVFLGAQVAARCIFLVDGYGGAAKGYLSRSDYNELGPRGVMEFVL